MRGFLGVLLLLLGLAEDLTETDAICDLRELSCRVGKIRLATCKPYFGIPPVRAGEDRFHTSSTALDYRARSLSVHIGWLLVDAYLAYLAEDHICLPDCARDRGWLRSS